MSSALARRSRGTPGKEARNSAIFSSPTRSTERWVSAGPGLTQLTRMRCAASSTAITWLIATSAALVAQYGVNPRPAPSALTEAVNPIEPPLPASRMARADSRARA